MTPYVDVDRARASVRVYRLVGETLAEAHSANGGRGRYRDLGYTVDVAGTADEVRHFAKGGVYNDAHGRSGHGIAPADASRLAGRLRAIGCRLRNADADALLLQAELGALVMAPPPATQEQERTKKANRREKARANGLCIVCATRPQREGRVTCQECSDAAKERVRIARSKP